MNTSKYVVASFAAAVWLLVYGFVVNSMLLADFWSSLMPSEGLMRPESEMVLWAIVLSCVLQGFALAFIFVRGYEGRGLVEGFRFGLLVAWFVAALYLLFFAIQPWTLQGWAASSLADGLMYVGAGIVLALVYKPGTG
jgi:hypothetical protein